VALVRSIGSWIGLGERSGMLPVCYSMKVRAPTNTVPVRCVAFRTGVNTSESFQATKPNGVCIQLIEIAPTLRETLRCAYSRCKGLRYCPRTRRSMSSAG
jgi:hypothetical protein